MPEIDYKLARVGTAQPRLWRGECSVQKIAAQPGHAETWQGAFVLPADAGLTAPETFEFIYSGSDSLDNVSTTIKPQNQFQVYQNDLPPLDTPQNLKAESLPKGKIKLAWDAVTGSSDYQLYRQGPSESSLSAYVRTGAVTEFTDSVSPDGVYTYVIASVRTENNQEALSAKSASVSVESDSIAPSAPENLTLEMTGLGIKAAWKDTKNTEEVTYSLYRSSQNEITSLEGLTQVQTGINILEAVDSTPSLAEHAYVVTAQDKTGNESGISNSVYLNFSLLPVTGVTVVQTDDNAPVVSWNDMAEVTGYNIYVGPSASQIKLNSALLTSVSFTDSGFSQNERFYTINSVDSQSIESTSHNTLLPKISAAIKDGTAIKRGLMNKVEFNVRNDSSQRIDNITIRVHIHTYDFNSDTFSIEANQTKTVSVVVGGYSDLPDISPLKTTIEIIPSANDKVSIVKNSETQIQNGMLAATIQNEEFVRGANGKVSFSLENTSGEEIEVITNQNASSDINFYLLDKDGNVLSSKTFIQKFGENVITLANGTTVARIAPGKIFSSAQATLPVPLSAPDDVIIKLTFSNIYYRLGESDQSVMDGFSTTRSLKLIDTSYYGEVLSVSPDVSRGNENIVITGRAVERKTSLALANVSLNLIFSVNNFEKKFSVFTDSQGAFTYNYKPQATATAGQAGVYYVCAVHPDLSDRPIQKKFTITAVKASPKSIQTEIPKNYEQKITVNLTAGEATTAQNLRLEYKAADQADAKFPDGVHVTIDAPAQPLNLYSGESGELSFTVWADNNAANTNNLILKVKSDETAVDSWETISVNLNLSEAAPNLSFTPSYIETGVKLDDTTNENLVVKNAGFSDAQDVKVTLLSQDGSAAPAWAVLNAKSEIGTIAKGQEYSLNLSFNPQANQVQTGIYNLILRFNSSNYKTVDYNVYVSVVESGIGSVLFKVSDLYTATTDKNGNVIQGVSGATVYIQNEAVTTVEYTKQTDSAGEALFTDLPSGAYRCRVTADKHQQSTARFWVKPGITVNQNVFLQYDLVTVEWSVRETSIEDKYEIVLTIIFETDVPAALIIAEPKSFTIPDDIKPGDVFNTEVRFTNYGFIRAQNIKFSLPANDQNFDYEIQGEIPETLEAKQSFTVPVRLICKQSLLPSGQGTGGGCSTYTTCVLLTYNSQCINGYIADGVETVCYTSVIGVCEGVPGVPYSYYGGTGVPSGTFGMSPGASTIQDSICMPDRPCEINNECCKQPAMQPMRSSVDLLRRMYEDDVADMSFKVVGHEIKVMRRFYDGKWHFDSDEQNLKFNYGASGIESITKDAVTYSKSDTDGTVYSFGINRNIYVKGSGYRWEDHLGNWGEYDKTGRLLYYGNRNNVKVTLIYESGDNGKLIGVKDNNGRQVLWYEYNSDGKLSLVKDFSERKAQYSYDGSGNLSKVTDLLGNETQFFYDSESRLIKKADSAGLTTDITYNEYGYVKTIGYENGKTISYDYFYDTAKQEYYSLVKFSNGKTIERWFDEFGRKIRTDINGITIEKIAYEGRDKIIIDAVGNKTVEKSDEWGNLIKKTFADGSIISYEYDLTLNQPIKKIDQRGIITKYEYDANGNMVKIIEAVGTDVERTTQYTYDSQGNTASVTDALNHKTQHEYNLNGNLTKITDPIGNTTAYTYDDRGNKLTETDANGNTTRYAFNLNDKLVSVSDALGNIATYAYDLQGNNISITYPDGNTTEYVYDEYKRLKRVIARTASEAKQDEAIYTYDNEDKLLTTTDANGNTTTYAYDNLERMTKVKDALGNITAYAYDTLDNLISITDAENHTTKNTYDSLGRLTKITDPLGFITQYYYDSVGNLIKKTDANNQTTEYEYDVLNLLTKISYGVKINPVKTVTFSYNKIGNLLNWDDGVYSASYTYDQLERPSQIMQNYPFGAKTISYEYNKAGNRTRVIASDFGQAIYTYDTLNRLNEITHNLQKTQYEYDNMSRLTKKTLPNGVYTDYNYDNLSRLTSLINKKSSGEVISNFDYTHDKVGNRLSMTTTQGTHNYVYDNIYRLTNAAHPDSPESYSYDKVGNRKTSREYSNWQYDSNNCLKSYNGATFTYDNNGNMLTKTDTSGTTTYAYDYENRLTNVIASGGEAIYSYDPFGRRLSKTVNGVAKYYLYDNEDIIAEYDSAGNLVASYVHGQGIDEPIARTDNRTPRTDYYTFDGLGSVSELTDSGQNITEIYKYDSFGRLQTVLSIDNPYSYTSREYDSETGVYFYRARYYNAGTGRFITADPIGFEGGINFYVYVENNPVNYIDPDGYLLIRPIPPTPTGNYPPPGPLTKPEDELPPEGFPKLGKWKVLSRCNVHSVDKCFTCPPTLSGVGYGPVFPIAKENAEKAAKAKLTRGCQTKHCHPIRCWKNGNRVPCPSWN